MGSRTYNLFMEARRAARVATGHLENREPVPEGVNPWTWAHSQSFAGAAIRDASKDKYVRHANKIGAGVP